jgi:addiction module HigA family antidote
MAKKVALPGDVIKSKLSEYLVNASSMARDSGINGSAIRLLTLGKARITVAIAFRLAKYFKTPVEYWLKLQEEYDIYLAKNDAKLQKALKSIVPAKKPTKSQLAAAKAKEDSEKKSKKKAAASVSKPKSGRGRKKADASSAVSAIKAKRGRKPKAPASEGEFIAPESLQEAPQAIEKPKERKATVRIVRMPRKPKNSDEGKIQGEPSLSGQAQSDSGNSNDSSGSGNNGAGQGWNT